MASRSSPTTARSWTNSSPTSGEGNRSTYLRATLKVMKSVMLAEQLRELQAYGQQRTAQLGIDPAQVPTRIQEFLKGETGHADQ